MSLTRAAVLLLSAVVVLAFATATGPTVLAVLGGVAFGLTLLDGFR